MCLFLSHLAFHRSSNWRPWAARRSRFCKLFSSGVQHSSPLLYIAFLQVVMEPKTLLGLSASCWSPYHCSLFIMAHRLCSQICKSAHEHKTLKCIQCPKKSRDNMDVQTEFSSACRFLHVVRFGALTSAEINFGGCPNTRASNILIKAELATPKKHQSL